jgi:WhiB family redox-sensing transcriptional regulator
VYDRRVIPTVFFGRYGWSEPVTAELDWVERARTVRELFLLDADAEEAGWQERALCAQTDPEAFFPEKGGSTREAKKVCLTCEVRGECLEYALMNDERFGIWGGLSERERRKLKKRAV